MSTAEIRGSGDDGAIRELIDRRPAECAGFCSVQCRSAGDRLYNGAEMGWIETPASKRATTDKAAGRFHKKDRHPYHITHKYQGILIRHALAKEASYGTRRCVRAAPNPVCLATHSCTDRR